MQMENLAAILLLMELALSNN